MSFADVQRFPVVNTSRLHHDAAEDVDDSELKKVQQVLTTIQRRRDQNETGNVELTMSEQEYLTWVIAEREDLVKKLVSEMRDTRQLMQDIALLVDEQSLFIGAHSALPLRAPDDAVTHSGFRFSS